MTTTHPATTRCTAFEGARRIASGDLLQVVLKVKKVVDRGERGPVVIFDDRTSHVIEVDFRGSSADVERRLAAGSGTDGSDTPADARRGPGRPKLGVVAREVTLLPRHWDWLNSQPGGASVALRKLVEEARRANESADRVREAQDAAYRFMSAMAGDRPGFEEATRAFFAGDRARFDDLVERWPNDIREHVCQLAAAAFESRGTA